ncbi:coiled-coil domain-containing protein 24 isoform X1 [Poecilia formosa]|uniref:coiled-coil domain-containing protein 24 isoform X1 n=1 Tax=Poecilia formosa TaxID=48698 RepID=UPI0007BA50BC|nr:PREDICTED: uncharacterized protein LOC103135708 isoform X1 [Poecilia formosa]
MHSPDENQLWCPGQSLWSLITEHVSESELLKIHAALGDPLVDMYTEVHSEAEMWHKKWQETLCYGSHRLQGSRLSDPPVVKELVRAEAKMLLETLKGRACNSEIDSEELLLQYKPETLSYVLGHQEIVYGRSSNLKTADNFNRPSFCSPVMSSAESEIEAVKDMLNVTEIHRVITPLRCVLLAECEALTKMTKHFKKNIKLKCISQCGLKKPEPSLTELKELRAAIQTDLKLLPSSSGASTSAPVSSKKKGFRFPAESGSCTHLAPSPKSGSRLDLLPLWQPKPRPPSHNPPARTSSVWTLGLHRSTSSSHESVKDTSSNRMDTNLKVTKSQENFSFSTKPDFTDPLCRTCSRLHISSERDSASHPSSQCWARRPNTDSDWSPHRERKISALCSRNINFTPSPPPPLGEPCDAGSRSSTPTDHSVSVNGKIKPDDRDNNCSSGRNLVLAVLQKDKSE